MSTAVSTCMSKRSTSCAVVKAPMPAKVAWDSESRPAMPVMTVIEQKMTA